MSGCSDPEPDEPELLEPQRQVLENAKGVEQQLQQFELERREHIDSQ